MYSMCCIVNELYTITYTFGGIWAFVNLQGLKTSSQFMSKVLFWISFRAVGHFPLSIGSPTLNREMVSFWTVLRTTDTETGKNLLTVRKCWMFTPFSISQILDSCHEKEQTTRNDSGKSTVEGPLVEIHRYDSSWGQVSLIKLKWAFWNADLWEILAHSDSSLTRPNTNGHVKSHVVCIHTDGMTLTFIIRYFVLQATDATVCMQLVVTKVNYLLLCKGKFFISMIPPHI